MKKGCKFHRHINADKQTAITVAMLVLAHSPTVEKALKTVDINCRKAVDTSKARIFSATGHVIAYDSNRRALRYLQNMPARAAVFRPKLDFSPVTINEFE